MPPAGGMMAWYAYFFYVDGAAEWMASSIPASCIFHLVQKLYRVPTPTSYFI